MRQAGVECLLDTQDSMGFALPLAEGQCLSLGCCPFHVGQFSWIQSHKDMTLQKVNVPQQ